MADKLTVLQTENGLLVGGLTCFDLDETMDCGQCFRFDRLPDGGWKGAAGGYTAILRIRPEGLLLEGVTRAQFDGFWKRYLDLERDYAAIRAGFMENAQLAECMRYAPGIRILRQPPWEALCSFIISQNNNVPRIKGIVQRLCRLFGNPLPGGAWDFPPADTLAGLTEEELAPLRAGWRAGYLLDAARRVSTGELELEEIAALPLPRARAELQRIRGVGPKVAECVLLYGMGRLEAFPLDVWMKRAMRELFPGYTPEAFGEYAGIAQQYIFHYCRRHPQAVRREA